MPQAIEDALEKLDFSLQRLSPEMFKLTQQLFDVLGMAITRGPLTGIWGSWENASSEQIRNFLHRWENSYLNLLRMGQGSLLKLVIMAWYFQPAVLGRIAAIPAHRRSRDPASPSHKNKRRS